jgi:hypothetical protein
VWFLRRRDTEAAQTWWSAVGDYPHGAPGVIRELLRCPSVVCDRHEAMQALAWARAHPDWREDQPAVEAVDALTDRL